MARFVVSVDLGAIRANARRLVEVLAGSELWAVVKADGYGHGAGHVARAALEGGAKALCVATVDEALALRTAFPGARIVVLGPARPADVRAAREARLELVVSTAFVPDGVPVHVKLDTGMGRWGLAELEQPGRAVVGLMTHFASADADESFTRTQLQRFLDATAAYGHLTRHAANSAAAFGVPEARLDAARCGIALYGISPFGDRPGPYGLRPALAWRSELAEVKLLRPGESTGYGRRFVAERETWIGLVPVGYADGFRRDLTGTEVAVAGERRRVLGTVSMDAFAVELSDEAAVGTPVSILGEGVLAEDHARIAETIAYEIVCGIHASPERGRREVVDA